MKDCVIRLPWMHGSSLDINLGRQENLSSAICYEKSLIYYDNCNELKFVLFSKTCVFFNSLSFYGIRNENASCDNFLEITPHWSGLEISKFLATRI